MENNRPAQYRAWTDEGTIDVERITFTSGDTVYVTSTDEKFDGYEFQIDIKDLMQYTGLSDKNDVPVYVGDTVKTHFATGTVKFESGSFVVNWDGTMLNKVMYFWDDNGFEGEVVGNIKEKHK